MSPIEELHCKIVAFHPEVGHDVSEDCAERADPERSVARNGDVVFGALSR